MISIADNLLLVQSKISEAAKKTGRREENIELLAVSKTWPAPVLREAIDAGIDTFGENRVQEAVAKIPLLPHHLHWHLIGHLQKNKVRKALPLFEVVHSVDSLELAQSVNRVAGELGCFPKIYVQVNIAEEGRKFGFSPDAAAAVMDEILDLEHLETLGLMTITPFSDDPENSRPHYVALRELRDRLEKETGVPLPGLSMGMSNDYPVAIEEGATIVRVGSSIFGARKNKPTAESSANA